MDSKDITVLIYPNIRQIRSIVIIDPFDEKVYYQNVNSIEEANKVLKEHLPFCSQGHPPMIHLGSAILFEWENLPEGLEIQRPEDIDKLLS